MENAAHAELLGHEVYRTPLTVQPEFEYRRTPDNYPRTYFGPGKVPDQIKVWRVQNTQKGNVVARGAGFEDSPDAEIIAVGFNWGKAYGDVGIGRQANVLQWGYSDPPSRMTEAGRRLFLNCIHYIRRFEGKTPLVRRHASGRCNALVLISYLKVVTDPKGVFTGVFPEELWEKYRSDFDGLLTYYKENLELVYWDQVYRVDNDLSSLGLESNRKVETLERLFELQKDPAHREIAQRLLDRYTDGHTTFDFQNGRDRIYFSDVGGYKFFVVPQGYLVVPNSGTGTLVGATHASPVPPGRRCRIVCRRRCL
jgi:hypothetical protein